MNISTNIHRVVRVTIRKDSHENGTKWVKYVFECENGDQYEVTAFAPDTQNQYPALSVSDW